jgi:hypothetical protein
MWGDFFPPRRAARAAAACRFAIVCASLAATLLADALASCSLTLRCRLTSYAAKYRLLADLRRSGLRRAARAGQSAKVTEMRSNGPQSVCLDVQSGLGSLSLQRAISLLHSFFARYSTDAGRRSASGKGWMQMASSSAVMSNLRSRGTADILHMYTQHRHE